MYRDLRLSNFFKCAGHAPCSFDDPRLLAYHVSLGHRGDLRLRGIAVVRGHNLPLVLLNLLSLPSIPRKHEIARATKVYAEA